MAGRTGREDAAHEDLVDLVRNYNPRTDEVLIRRAYAYGADMHQGQKRHSGEPYFTHPVAVASATRAVRGQGLPYLYALSRDKSPLLYFRLPTREEMNDSEAENVADRAAAFRSRAASSDACSMASADWNTALPPAAGACERRSLRSPLARALRLRRPEGSRTRAPGALDPDSGANHVAGIAPSDLVATSVPDFDDPDDPDNYLEESELISVADYVAWLRENPS